MERETYHLDSLQLISFNINHCTAKSMSYSIIRKASMYNNSNLYIMTNISCCSPVYKQI